MSLREELGEQPVVAARLLGEGRRRIAAVAAELRSRPIDFVVIAARGTSDHAAIYAQYVLGIRHRLPVALATPSTISIYGVAPRFERTLVLGISQSGASPDVVGVVAAARAQGAPTVAITNTPDSPLATAAEHVIELQAGPERAVAATKTYGAELLSLALLSQALAETADPADEAALQGLPAVLEAALASEPAVEEAARRQAAMEACVVLGRGYDYATAREWSLKLKELAYVAAEPYSAADFEHGPLAIVQPGFPVLAVAAGRAADGLEPLLRRLRDELAAELLVMSDRPALAALGPLGLPIPGGLPDWLLPVVAIVPAQLHAYHLTRLKGLDPELPRHLQKVTRTH
ncbi:MAG TPA: SIS domain-containing protein [Candidatus Dormibacteraeota bacterium]|nr:SIS domain-containing protein [Candidatus Dormibacteraeota bacterium]